MCAANPPQSPLEDLNARSVARVDTVRPRSVAADKAEEIVVSDEVSYRAVIEKCAVGMALLSIEGSFEDVNHAFCELAGHSRETLSNTVTRFCELLHPEEAERCHQHFATLCRGEEESYRQTQRLLRPNGTALWIDLTVNLMRTKRGAPHRLVVTAVDTTEQTRTESAFRDMSFSDPLTKLPNRRLLKDRLQSAVTRARRDDHNVALLFIDLDGFKPINDSAGHAIGDWLLKAVAERLVTCLREYDTAARLGGDEFVVLLPDLSQPEDASRVAERIRASLSSPFIMEDGKRFELSASIGVSLYPENADNAHALLRASDEAMYRAKRSGRNRIAFCDRGSIAVPIPIMDANSGLVQLTWDSRFASGNAFIDAEHRELFYQSNLLLDLTTSAKGRMSDLHAGLVRLVQIVDEHFRHEERILAQVSYCDLAAHIAKHRRLMEHAEELCRRTTTDTALAHEIVTFVVAETIYGHIVTEDRDFFVSLQSGVVRQ